MEGDGGEQVQMERLDVYGSAENLNGFLVSLKRTLSRIYCILDGIAGKEDS